MSVFNSDRRPPVRPDLVSAVRDAKDIIDKAVPYEPNIARDDLTEIRKIAFSIVLRELLIAAKPRRPDDQAIPPTPETSQDLTGERQP
jgi:hypothetical protein